MATVEPLRMPAAERGATLTAEERAVIEALRATRFGSVEVIVHQSRIVQLVRSEKQRFEPGPA